LFVLILTGLIFIAALISSFGLRWQEDILSILPDEDPQIAKYRMLIKHFNPMDAMFVDVGLPDDIVLDESVLITAADSLAAVMQRSGHFTRIMYKWNFSDLTNTMQLLREHRAELFTKQDSLLISRLMQPDSIRQKLSSWKRQLAEAPTPFIVKQMLANPVGFDAVIISKISAMQGMNSDVQIMEGRLFSKDKRHLLLIAYPEYSASDSYHSGQIVTFMDSTIKKIQDLDRYANVKISYLSGHRFSVENAQRIKRDIKVTVSVSLIAIALLALLIYSRPFLMLLTLLPAIFGTTVSLGLIRWLAPDISAIVIGSGAMLIGLAVDYGIHFLFHIDQQALSRQDTKPLAGLLQRLRKPLLLSGASTVIAFMTLRLSILPGYNQLGLFVSLGIVSALGFVLIVLPHLLPVTIKKKKILPTLKLAGFFPTFFQWNAEHKSVIISLLIIISLIMIPGIMRVQFEGDVQKLNAVSPEIQQDWDTITKSFGASMASTYIIVKGSNQEQALQKNDRLSQSLKNLQTSGHIISYNSLASIFPSQKTQSGNRMRWNQLMSNQRMSNLANQLESAAIDLGFRPKTFSQFIQHLQDKGNHLQLGELEGTVIRDIFSNQVSENGNETAVLSQIKIRSHLDFAQIKKRLEQTVPDVVIYNGKDFVSNIVHLIFNELKRMGFIVISLIFLLLLLYKRNLKTTFALLLPLLLSALWTFGIMGWLGININIINSIVSVFVFGLVIDYCFFLQSACESKAADKLENLKHSGAAVTISAFTTMFGLGALLLARHPAMHSLGLTALLGIGSGLIVVLSLIPMYFCSDKKNEKGVI